MLTHKDDNRIMTAVDMLVIKELSSFNLESTTCESRLRACMRLLLGHIEGMTDGAIAAVEGLKTKRDPPRNKMTDIWDEGYDTCQKYAEMAIRKVMK